ncbi:MAG: hypothetical protein ACPG8W_19825 [Candidatus Promineifilaceae bacterium]
MNEINDVFSIVGTLGAFFAFLTLVSVVVETILSSIKNNRWLNEKIGSHEWLAFMDIQDRHISPDQAMRDIAYWVPAKSQADMQLATIHNLAKEFNVTLDEFTRGADAMLVMSKDLVALTGMSRQAAMTKQDLASKLYVLRQKYDSVQGERIGRIRRIAAVTGVIIASVFRLNALLVLAPILSPDAQMWLDSSVFSFGGVVLTGVAASAGSSFWHDQLVRVRSVKETANSLRSLASIGTN